MNTLIKKILSIILLFSLLSLAGCETREDKAKKAFVPLAQTLIQGGVDICQTIYLGGGLEADVSGSDVKYDSENGSYYPVLSDKYNSITSMKHDTELVFTPGLAEDWLYRDAFEGERSLYCEKNGVLCVDITNTAARGYGREWLYDSIVITRISDVDAEATIDTRRDDEAISSMTVDFVKTADGWRINSRLYD